MLININLTLQILQSVSNVIKINKKLYIITLWIVQNIIYTENNSKKNISKQHNTFQHLSNRQLKQIIQGNREENIEHSIYKNIYQFIKLYIVLTGRFVA